MWIFFDIAYIVPACCFLAFSISKYALRQEDHSLALLIGAALGFILTIYKIQKYINNFNKNFATKEQAQKQLESQNLMIESKSDEHNKSRES